ncbi:hypothetical protein LCGC14_1442380, partial [marine sediment metagenome]
FAHSSRCCGRFALCGRSNPTTNIAAMKPVDTARSAWPGQDEHCSCRHAKRLQDKDKWRDRENIGNHEHGQHRPDRKDLVLVGDGTIPLPITDDRAKYRMVAQPSLNRRRAFGKGKRRKQHQWRGWKQRKNNAQDAQSQS